MIKFIFLGIIVIALIVCAIILIIANRPKKVEAQDPDLDSSQQSRNELESLKQDYEIKIKTLDNKKEIKKLQNLIAGIDAKLNQIKS